MEVEDQVDPSKDKSSPTPDSFMMPRQSFSYSVSSNSSCDSTDSYDDIGNSGTTGSDAKIGGGADAAVNWPLPKVPLTVSLDAPPAPGQVAQPLSPVHNMFPASGAANGRLKEPPKTFFGSSGAFVTGGGSGGGGRNSSDIRSSTGFDQAFSMGLSANFAAGAGTSGAPGSRHVVPTGGSIGRGSGGMNGHGGSVVLNFIAEECSDVTK